MKLFAIRDIKAEGFNIPFCQPTFGLAERMFKDAVKDQENQLSKHPEDFALYHVGEFDNKTGTITALDVPQHVCDAI